LAHDVVPRTVENFMRLCEGSQQFTYKGSKVCDILKESSLRLGDVETNTGVLS
jgi:cyclophilin family peptidyl-prolyl cis-trans isomerase